jgi:hypothetical protein
MRESTPNLFSTRIDSVRVELSDFGRERFVKGVAILSGSNKKGRQPGSGDGPGKIPVSLRHHPNRDTRSRMVMSPISTITTRGVDVNEFARISLGKLSSIPCPVNSFSPMKLGPPKNNKFEITDHR